MTTMRLACLAALLLAAACGGIADDPSFEYSGDEVAVESPAAALDEVEAPAPAPEVAPSTPAPSDEPAPAPAPEAVPEPAPAPAPSPATRDDEPAPSPMEGGDEPAPAPEAEPVAGWIQGGDVCTETAQCVDGLTCTVGAVVVPGGTVEALVCAYDRRAAAPPATTSTPGIAEDGAACNTDELCASGLCTPARPGDITGICEPMPADGVIHFCRWLTTGCR